MNASLLFYDQIATREEIKKRETSERQKRTFLSTTESEGSTRPLMPMASVRAGSGMAVLFDGFEPWAKDL